MSGQFVPSLSPLLERVLNEWSKTCTHVTLSWQEWYMSAPFGAKHDSLGTLDLNRVANHFALFSGFSQEKRAMKALLSGRASTGLS